VILETIDPSILPEPLHADFWTLVLLGQVYKQLEAPFGQLAHDALTVSTYALESNSTSDTTYIQLESDIESWTNQRDSLGAQIKEVLEEAEFGGQGVDELKAQALISEGLNLLNQAASVTGPLAGVHEARHITVTAGS
jgi:hypothetical protein